MANPTYQRMIICDSTDVAARLVAAAETDLHPNYLERVPPSVAETERAWFDQQVGGLSRSPGSMTAAFRLEHPKIDPFEWVANQINNSVNVALYSIDPNGCCCGLVRRHQPSDDARFGDPALYQSLREGDAVVIFSLPDQYSTCELYQRLVRHFGFISEQSGWAPDFFYTEPGAAIDREIADEHAWFLRGRGEGDGYPQHFNVMTRYLPGHWFERIYGDGEQMSYKDDVTMHQIMSLGLSADELGALRQAELASAVYRIEADPACRPLLLSIIEKAVRDGVLELFDQEEQIRKASTQDRHRPDKDDEYFAQLAGQTEESGKGDFDPKAIDDSKAIDHD